MRELVLCTSDLGEEVKVVDEYVYTIYRVGLDDAIVKGKRPVDPS